LIHASSKCVVVLLLAQFFSLASIAQSNSAPPKSESPEPREATPEAGSIVGDSYKNNFFDLTFEFPKGWFPASQATKQHMKELEAAAASGHNPGVAVVLNHSYNLLIVFENEPGTPGVQFLRSELLTATDVSFAPGIKTGEDYLIDVLPSLKKVGYNEFSIIRPVKLGNRVFYQADVKRQIRENVTLCQSIFVTLVKGYALKLVVSTDDPYASARLVKNIGFTFGPNADVRSGENTR
jgi:hypothetical protein